MSFHFTWHRQNTHTHTLTHSRTHTFTAPLSFTHNAQVCGICSESGTPSQHECMLARFHAANIHLRIAPYHHHASPPSMLGGLPASNRPCNDEVAIRGEMERDSRYRDRERESCYIERTLIERERGERAPIHRESSCIYRELLYM